MSSSTEQELRERIRDAAEERFRVFGYCKTTMAEIAQDVSMSAANLYRYFANKHDIAAECANKCMAERTAWLRERIRTPGLNAAEKLRAFVLGTFEYTYERATKEPKMNELVEIVARERNDIVHHNIKDQCALIAEILAHGNHTGEFAVENVIDTARTILATLTLFEVPIFLPLYAREEFVQTANNVVDLLLKGLQKR